MMGEIWPEEPSLETPVMGEEEPAPSMEAEREVPARGEEAEAEEPNAEGGRGIVMGVLVESRAGVASRRRRGVGASVEGTRAYGASRRRRWG